MIYVEGKSCIVHPVQKQGSNATSTGIFYEIVATRWRGYNVEATIGGPLLARLFTRRARESILYIMVEGFRASTARPRHKTVHMNSKWHNQYCHGQ
jgi:hypothetical protein